ncbi:MAG: PDZ domain-containing protein [Nitriliruptorales bacterium]|nr:PDZ domain-containing protein [Nitriliruptorales bacterium]
MADPVRYRVDLADRLHHLVRVSVRVPDDLRGQSIRLVLPAWTPGSYVIRDYVHDVQSIRGSCGDAEVALRPDGRSAWRLDAAPDAETTVTLEVFGHSPSVRTNHIDDHHALIIPAATFPWIDGAADRPHEVAFDRAETVWSMLPADGGTYLATNYLHLVDTAFEVGDHPSVTWQNAGVEHRFVWTGRAGHPDLAAIAADAQQVIDAAIDLFGGDLPTDAYTFLCYAWDKGGGGLEHRDGAVILVPAHTHGDADGRARLVSLLAHEYLHLWNVKRLTPAALVEPDLEQPVFTESLWVAEGWTSYWDELLPLRAGVWTPDRWLKSMGEVIEAVTNQPGRDRQTLREASHQAWVKYYVRDENWVNAGTDYYRHGALVALALDMHLRTADVDGGLDAVMRLLWERHGRSSQGYTEADVEAAVSEVAGDDMGWFFERFVDGTELPDVESALATVGAEPAPSEGTDQHPWLGVQTAEAPTGVQLSAVLRDGPGWAGGLTGGDLLVAVDGHVTTAANLGAVLSQHEPGDTVTCDVIRGPNLLQRRVVLGEPHLKQAWRWSPAVDDETAARHIAWRGAPHPSRADTEAARA